LWHPFSIILFGKGEIAMRKQERRCRERVQFLRPIVYVYHNSDKFIEATMLNHGPSGICFQSTPPVAPGSKIYILTEEASLQSISSRGADAVYAKVMWCERKSGAHWVGVQYINNAVSYNVEQWGEPDAPFEYLPVPE
jgi:hypothetical protein